MATPSVVGGFIVDGFRLGCYFSRMDKNRRVSRSIDEYIRSFPKHVQAKLSELRLVIKQIAPDAQEKISYQMPAFYLNGNLVYFAAHSHHIGFYPTSSGIANFRSQLSKYKNSKGAIQFPIDEPLPIDLIKRIVKFRVQENSKKK